MKTKLLLAGAAIGLSACVGVQAPFYTEEECRAHLTAIGQNPDQVTDAEFETDVCRYMRSHDDPAPVERTIEPVVTFTPPPVEEQFPEESCDGDDCGSPQ